MQEITKIKSPIQSPLQQKTPSTKLPETAFYVLPVKGSLTVLGKRQASTVLDIKKPKKLSELEIYKKRLVIPGAVPEFSESLDQKIDSKERAKEQEFLDLYSQAQRACYQKPETEELQSLYAKMLHFYLSFTEEQQQKHAETWIDLSIAAKIPLRSNNFAAYRIFGHPQFEKQERLKIAIHKALDEKGDGAPCAIQSLLDFAMHGWPGAKYIEQVVRETPLKRPPKTVASAVVALYLLENFEEDASVKERYHQLFESIWILPNNRVTHTIMTSLILMVPNLEIAARAFDKLEKSELDDVYWVDLPAQNRSM